MLEDVPNAREPVDSSEAPATEPGFCPVYSSVRNFPPPARLAYTSGGHFPRLLMAGVVGMGAFLVDLIGMRHPS
jgi:hypothetical protein